MARTAPVEGSSANSEPCSGSPRFPLVHYSASDIDGREINTGYSLVLYITLRKHRHRTCKIFLLLPAVCYNNYLVER